VSLALSGDEVCIGGRLGRGTDTAFAHALQNEAAPSHAALASTSGKGAGRCDGDAERGNIHRFLIGIETPSWQSDYW
jgi:hypothetical protein